MELRTLEYFVAVAEELSFTRAATRLRVAQPAVSQQIRRLERELRQELVDRTGRRIGLTPAGERFLVHARSSLDAVQAGIDDLRTFAGELSGALSVGTVPVPPDWLAERIASFQREHPAVRTSIVTGSPEALSEQVASESLDLALVGVAGSRRPAGAQDQRLGPLLGSVPVERTPLVVIVRKDHELADRPQVTLRQVVTHPMVTLLPGTGLRAVLESAFAEADVSASLVAETNDVHLLPLLVRAGLGTAVVPAPIADLNPDLERIQLVRPSLERVMTLVWHRRTRSRLVRAFVSEILGRPLDVGSGPDAVADVGRLGGVDDPDDVELDQAR